MLYNTELQCLFYEIHTKITAFKNALAVYAIDHPFKFSKKSEKYKYINYNPKKFKPIA